MQNPPPYDVVASSGTAEYPILKCSTKTYPVVAARVQPLSQGKQLAIFDMGFDRHLVDRALQQFGGDEQQAVDFLLTGRASASPQPQVAIHNASPNDLHEQGEARRQLLGVQNHSDISLQIYGLLPASARKAGWDTRSIQSALDLPSLGFSQGTPGQRSERLFDAILSGKLSMSQLLQAESAMMNDLAAAAM
jgi:hypothetical protein